MLTPNGRLAVLEHVRGPGRLAAWQDRLTPLWQQACAGCHPNRDTRAAVERAGFSFDGLNEFRLGPDWLIMSPMLQATAKPAIGCTGVTQAPSPHEVR